MGQVLLRAGPAGPRAGKAGSASGQAAGALGIELKEKSDWSNLGLARDLYETEEGRKRLADMTPEKRRDALRAVKLSDALRQRLAKGGKGDIEIQVWLTKAPKDALAQLAKAGFTLAADLRPGKLLLGTISPAKLDALLALEFVRAVELPRLK
jgi:hypothetical protein